VKTTIMSGIIRSSKLKREPKKDFLNSGAINVIIHGVLTMGLSSFISLSKKIKMDS
jgi:hypothetical protein